MTIEPTQKITFEVYWSSRFTPTDKPWVAEITWDRGETVTTKFSYYRTELGAHLFGRLQRFLGEPNA